MIFKNGWLLLLICLLALLVILFPPTAISHSASSTENVLIFWTDGSLLKAVTLVSIHPKREPVGIVAIPITTKVENARPMVTLKEFYQQYGRQKLTSYLEKCFGITITSYYSVDQKTLLQASNTIGPITIIDKKTSFLEVFEGTYADQRDLQVEIRFLAAELIKPSMLVKIPYLLWIFTTQVETNLKMGHILTLYNALCNHGPGILNKQVLPGQDYFAENIKYREVPPDAWITVLKNVTQASK